MGFRVVAMLLADITMVGVTGKTFDVIAHFDIQNRTVALNLGSPIFKPISCWAMIHSLDRPNLQRPFAPAFELKTLALCRLLVHRDNSKRLCETESS